MEECSFVEPLLEWWRRTGPRSYPWRRARGLYEVLVAVVLLRKTRRDMVAKTYPLLLDKYPSPEALAAAPVSEIEELIRPLGLTGRARLLKKIGEALSRGIPGRDLGELPGVGPYTASTVKTILGMAAELEPDTSIIRLLTRYHGLHGKPGIKEILNKCAPRDPEERKEYLLALLDHAWEVCRPRRPRCAECSLRDQCREYQRGR